jgi:hypothetical protein
MTDVRDLLTKLQNTELRISRERGPFVLFALFLREGSLDRWDVVISAPWAEENLETLRYLDREFKKDLIPEDFGSIARYDVLPPDFEPLAELYEEHPVEHGKVIVRNREFGLQMVQKGYIITCRPPVAKAA